MKFKLSRKQVLLIISFTILMNGYAQAEFSGKFRSYYLDQSVESSDSKKTLTAGGWLQYDTPPWNGLSLRLTDYYVQGLFSTAPKDGYSVLGQINLKASFDDTDLTLYRQALDTPFINTYDVRIIPVLVEAYTVEYKGLESLDLLASHVTNIKGWTDTQFKSMTAAAGFSNADEAVTLVGAVYSPSADYSVQLWDYYCYEFMNVSYFQLDKTWPQNDDLAYSCSFQAFDQQDVGRAIAGQFHAGMMGILGGLTWQGLYFNAGCTSTGNDHDIVNPWGSYPGYTSLMEEDSDLAGEKAWVIGLAYDFEKIGWKGLSAFTNYSNAYLSNSDWGNEPHQEEANLTVDYRFNGELKGFWLRLRSAMARNMLDMDGDNGNDYRININYDF